MGEPRSGERSGAAGPRARPAQWYPAALFQTPGNLSFNAVSDWQGQEELRRVGFARTFHRAAAPLLLGQGLLELDVLFAGKRALAATYVLRRTSAQLLPFGYDRSDARLSLGSLAIWRSVRGPVRRSALRAFARRRAVQVRLRRPRHREPALLVAGMRSAGRPAPQPRA